MVTLTKYGAKYNRNILFLEGLSTDTKPTGEFDGLSIQNGSEYTEVDTGKKFLFDYDNATWYEVQTGGGGGGGGGTSNYNDLSNRPSVNNTVLTGNKTSAQLGLASSEQGGKADSAIQGVKLNSGSVITPDANSIVDITVGKADVGLGNVTNDAQVKKISSSTSGDIVTWSGTSGDTVADSGVSIETSITDSDLKIPTSKAVNTALSDKVDKVTGKGLSTNDYTTAEKTKLAGIAEGAEVNVQSNWTQTTTTADDYIKNKPTLGTAAAKNATDTYNATGTDVTTGKAVAAALATLPEPMVFKGSLGTGGTITTLPTASSSNKGYVYKVITAGTYASQSAKVGDTFISDGSAWVLIPSGDEPSGTVTNVAVTNGGGLAVSGSPITSSGTITVGHSNSVTAKTSSSVKKFTYDANGHVTGSSELSTAESNALASGIDSAKVAQINTNQTNIGKVQAQANWNTNNGVKNLSPYNNGTATSPLVIPVNFKSGESYIVSWDSITSTSSADSSRMVFMSGESAVSNIYYASHGVAGSATLTLTADCDSLWVYAGSTYEGNKTVTISNFMIRPATIADSTYEPYAMSNAELTAKEQTNESNILLKANTSDVNTATSNLQNQIDQIVISASAEAVVAPEVAAARVGADGTSYTTLKKRIDGENIQLNSRIDSAKDEVGLRNVFDETDNDMLSGKYIDASGNEVTNANFCETGYIPCTANDKLAVVVYNYNAAGDKTTSLLSVAYAVYDSGKNFVASGNTDTTNFITVSTASVAYIRVAIPAQYKNIAIYCSDIGAVDILPDEKSVYYKNANEQIADCSKNLSDLESQKIISKKTGNLPEDAYIIYGKYINTETGNLGNSTTLSTIVCPYKPDTMAYILNCKDCFSSSGFSDEYVIRYRTSHGVISQSNLMANVSQLAIYHNSDNMTVIINDADVKDIIITALTDYVDNISIITSDNSDEIANNKLPSDLIDLYNDIPTAHNILEESKCFGKLSVYKFPNETTWRAYYGTGNTPIKSYGLYRLKKGETITAYGAQDLYICGFVLNKDLEVVQDLTILNGTTSTSYTAIEDCYLELSGNSLSDATKFIITKPKYAGSIPTYAIEGTSFGNQWFGKKWCALGTSLTSSSWGRYASRLAALSGMQEVNLGVPNGIIGPLGRSTERPSIMSQIANVPSDSDLITLEGFVNDWEEAGDFGEFGDTTADTFCGALYVALNALTSVSNAFVVGLTMPTGINTCNPYYKNQLNKYQYEYNDIFIKTCRAFGVPVIECDKCGVNVNTASLYLRDSIHHTDLGGQLIANYIWKNLERIDNKLLS